MDGIKALVRLSEDENTAVKNLLKICCQADQVPVTIQTDKTLNRYQDMNSWFLAYSGEILVGIVSVFSPLDTEAELTGCVHPDFRRQGIFKRLVSTAIEEIRSFNISRLLFSLDRRSPSGQAIVQGKGYPLDHTEYSMIFHEPDRIESIRPRLHLLRTGFGELEECAQISAAAFEEPLEAARSILANGLKTPEREQYAAYSGNRMVAVVSLLIREKTAMIHGLAVKPQEQGKGHGADFLAQLLRMLKRRELQVCLDVDSGNCTAYGLYKRMGFKETDIQDYYVKLIPETL